MKAYVATTFNRDFLVIVRMMHRLNYNVEVGGVTFVGRCHGNGAVILAVREYDPTQWVWR